MPKYSQSIQRNATREERADYFIARAKAIHGNVYDYSFVRNTFTKQQALVTIVCKKCGPFEQLATNHLAGKGCLKCAAKERMQKRYPEHAAALKAGNKICGSCKKKKPLNVFSNSPSRSSGVSGWCKECENKHKQTKYKDRIRNSNLKKYGLDQKSYQQLLQKQGNKCKICGIYSEIAPGVGFSKGGVLCVDHDHLTNKIRGLLCSKCNTGLGLFFDDISNLENAILYLKEANHSTG
jgi:hypothetical protein